MIPLFVHVVADDQGALTVDGTGDAVGPAYAAFLTRIENRVSPVRAMNRQGLVNDDIPDHALLINLNALTATATDVGTLVNAILTEPGLHAIYQLGKQDGMRLERRGGEEKLTPEDQRRRMWLHLGSMHATFFNPAATWEELVEYHAHEHDGPGTIRDHDPYDRSWTPDKLAEVIREHEANS